MITLTAKINEGGRVHLGWTTSDGGLHCTTFATRAHYLRASQILGSDAQIAAVLTPKK